MPLEKSVTHWIAAVRTGDAIAAEQLWQRYFQQLMHQARLRMGNVSKGSYDEEDAALSTFHILCQKLEQGHYPQLQDRQELWQLMLTVLVRKINRRVKYQSASKRPQVKNCGVMASGSVVASIDDLPAPTSQEISYEYMELVSSLKDPHLEQVALLRFEGYTNDEIAVKLNRTRRTIQRMLNLIRSLWEEELHSDSN